MDPKRETPLYPRSFLIPLRGISLRKERKRKKRKRSRNLLLLSSLFHGWREERNVRVRANLTRIFSNRWSVSCRVCENRFEKLLYKKSREQGGEEKLENNRGDRVAVLTPFLFFSLLLPFPLLLFVRWIVVAIEIDGWNRESKQGRGVKREKLEKPVWIKGIAARRALMREIKASKLAVKQS